MSSDDLDRLVELLDDVQDNACGLIEVQQETREMFLQRMQSEGERFPLAGDIDSLRAIRQVAEYCRDLSIVARRAEIIGAHVGKWSGEAVRDEVRGLANYYRFVQGKWKDVERQMGFILLELNTKV